MRGYQPEPKLSECGFIIAELDFLDSAPIKGALAAHNSSSALVIRVMCGWPDGGLMMVLWAFEVDITCAELEFW